MAIIAFHPCGQSEEAVATGGTFSFQGTTVRSTGRQALQCNPTTTGTGTAAFGNWSSTGIVQSMNIADCYATFYFRFATAPAANSEPICQIVNSASTLKLELRLTSAGNLSLYDTGIVLVGTGSTSLSANTWYRIGIRSGNGVSANYAVYVAAETADFGAAELSGTCDQSTTNIDRVRLGKTNNRNSQTVDFFFQDLLIDDAQVWNSYKIGIALPIANGTDTAWTGTYTDCDEYPHDTDTTFIEDTTLSDAETYDMSSFTTIGGAGGDTIHGVVLTAIRRRTTASTTNQRLRLRSGATTDETSSTNAGTTYALGGKLYLTDPQDAGAWTSTKFDALEAGGSLQSAATARITQVALNCLFTTPAVPSAGQPTMRRWNTVPHLGGNKAFARTGSW
jgi:hypothetical protein